MSDMKVDLSGVWKRIREELGAAGVELDCCDVDLSGSGDRSPGVKVVCVATGLKDSVEELSRSQRDQVVMVRVDEETSKSLDSWVETGAVKSRSEAAALFIREGLRVRAKELEQLNGALREVENAKRNLKERARQVFGAGDE